MKRLEGVEMVFGDYLQLFKSGKRFDSRASEVGYVWRGMKDTAQDLGVPICALAQGSRESFKGERPLFHQSEGSGEAEKSVDVGMVLSTHFDKGDRGSRPATIYVDYQRDEDAQTQAEFIFHGRTMEFTELRLPDGYDPLQNR
jgi:replicative DNA helicase